MLGSRNDPVPSLTTLQPEWVGGTGYTGCLYVEEVLWLPPLRRAPGRSGPPCEGRREALRRQVSVDDHLLAEVVLTGVLRVAERSVALRRVAVLPGVVDGCRDAPETAGPPVTPVSVW